MNNDALFIAQILSGLSTQNAAILDTTKGSVATTILAALPDNKECTITCEIPTAATPDSKEQFSLILLEGDGNSGVIPSLDMLRKDGVCAFFGYNLEMLRNRLNPTIPIVNVDGLQGMTLAVAAKTPDTLQNFGKALRAHMGLHGMLNQYQGDDYEGEVSRWITAVIQPGWNVVDVGAHVGVVSIQMANKVGMSGKVYSFDASPQNIEDLKMNLATMGISSRVQPVWSAITDGTSNEVTLFSGRNNWSAEWNLQGVDVEGKQTQAYMTVPSTSLDTYFGTRPVQFVKIDVEGSGTGVINGMANLLKNQRPLILFEYHGEREDDALKTLRANRYKLFELSSKRELAVGESAYHMIAEPH